VSSDRILEIEQPEMPDAFAIADQHDVLGMIIAQHGDRPEAIPSNRRQTAGRGARQAERPAELEGRVPCPVAIQAERHQGMTPEQAIRQACILRFRPIMMTTMAALLGAVPLAFGHGTGSELRQPLGYTMVGGLLVSQALTLFTTPVVYLYLDRLNHWLGRRRHTQPTKEIIVAGE
jgi:hypothetical protein